MALCVQWRRGRAGKHSDALCETFAPCGFRADAFFPVYGLAEATVLVSAAERPRAPRVHAGRVGLGPVWHGVSARIVDPESLQEMAAGETGEIWLTGDSVAKGYFRNEAETARVFHAHTARGEGPFLRTGDLGALVDGELVVSGRIKDVIIVRGENH